MRGRNVKCSLQVPLIILFLASAAFAAGNDTTEGGNITHADIAQPQAPSTWHAVFGHVSGLPFSPATINATPDNLTLLDISTGSSSCAYGVSVLNLLFSNSSSAITSLSPGSLGALDSFVERNVQNGSGTFASSTTFSTASYGSISGVPTTYTEPASSQVFREGYLQDQAGNIVFITPAVGGQIGFNMTPVDFQAILPTSNGTALVYYATVDIACNPAPPPPPQPGGGPTYTVSPGRSIPIYREIPNVTIPLLPPSASDLRVLTFSPFREVLPGDNIIINPLLENPTDRSVTITISLSGAGAGLAKPVANILLPAGDKRTVPFALHIPEDMPAGYYSLLMNVSTGKSDVSYPSIVRVVRSYRVGQPAVKRQFSLDYENGETMVSLTVTNRGKDPLSHIQVYESVPAVFFDKSGNRKFTTQLTSVAGEGSSHVEGSSIRWDVENVLPYESRTIFYRVPILLTDLSDYSGWNLAQLTTIDTASQTEIFIRDLQVPTMLPGEKGEISLKLFNSGGTAHDVEMDIIGPQGWKINPRSLSLNMPSRDSEGVVFGVESPPFSEAGTYGFTLRLKYRDTVFDKQVFVYVYKPVVELFAPPLPEQFVAWMGGSLPGLLLLGFVAVIAAGIAFAIYRKINSARYSQERFESLKLMESMLNTGEEVAKQSRRKNGKSQPPPIRR